MQTHPLTAHPATPPSGEMQIECSFSFKMGWAQFRYRVRTRCPVLLPPFAGKRRADDLWRTTCFELFVRHGEGPAYSEFNFSPSERWAAYQFDAYRSRPRDRPLPRDPVCTIRQGRGMIILDAVLPLAGLPELAAKAGLSAVIEEETGTRSYWALFHPGGKPDFHHPDCFRLDLPPPSEA